MVDKNKRFKIAAGIFMETESGQLFVMTVEMARNAGETSSFHVEDVVSPEDEFSIHVTDEEFGEPSTRTSIFINSSEVDEFCQKLKSLRDMVVGEEK